MIRACEVQENPYSEFKGEPDCGDYQSLDNCENKVMRPANPLCFQQLFSANSLNCQNDGPHMNDVDATEHELLLALFDEHAPVVRALLLRIVGGEEEVEDLLIKTFAEAWENFPSLDVDPLSALIEIARERGLAWARANGGKIPFDESRLMKTLLPESLLARLPLMQRQAVEHVFLTGGSISSFAQQMDVPRDWVFTVLTRALSAFWGEQRD